MSTALVILSCALAVAWLPLAARFNRGWKNRKNPVSLAICIAVLLFAYTNIMFAFAEQGQTSWEFVTVATHVFDVFTVVNFYIAFRWSDKKFPDARRGYSIPPTNTASTSRQP